MTPVRHGFSARKWLCTDQGGSTWKRLSCFRCGAGLVRDSKLLVFLCLLANLLTWFVAMCTFNAPYEGSVKEPDFSWMISGEMSPSLAVEVGSLENYQERLRGMDVWVVGSAAQTRVGILIILDRQDGGIGSFLEVLRPASANGSTIEPRIVQFPCL